MFCLQYGFALIAGFNNSWLTGLKSRRYSVVPLGISVYDTIWWHSVLRGCFKTPAIEGSPQLRADNIGPRNLTCPAGDYGAELAKVHISTDEAASKFQ